MLTGLLSVIIHFRGDLFGLLHNFMQMLNNFMCSSSWVKC